MKVSGKFLPLETCLQWNAEELLHSGSHQVQDEGGGLVLTAMKTASAALLQLFLLLLQDRGVGMFVQFNDLSGANTFLLLLFKSLVLGISSSYTTNRTL